MEIHVMKFEDIAAFVANELQAVVQANPKAVIGLTTGTTPLKTGL